MPCLPCLGLKRSLPNLLDLCHVLESLLLPCAFAMPYLKDMPYCETDSKPLFHTSVTSQALVADKRQERKADTEFPPTTNHVCVSSVILASKSSCRHNSRCLCKDVIISDKLEKWRCCLSDE